MSVRTRLLDELLAYTLEHEGIDCVVNLGCGFDNRSLRLQSTKQIDWYDIDFPEIIEEKKKVYASEGIQHIFFYAMDLSVKKEREDFFSSINERYKAILVVTEGLIYYFGEEELLKFISSLKSHQNIRAWVFDFISPFLYQYTTKLWKDKFSATAKFKSHYGPSEIQSLFVGSDIKKLMYTAEEYDRLNRPMKGAKAFKMMSYFLPKSLTDKYRHMSGCALLRFRSY
jgi:O-methyltransferase involved in polyketide biosynthesis